MLIADKIYRFKDFPMIPTTNMRDLAVAAINSGKCTASELIVLNNVITCYNTATVIDFKTYTELSYCFDTYVGNLPIINIPLCF